MSEESVPQQGGPADGPPKGLLQQMEELMAALNADLSALDADLHAAGQGRAGGAGTSGAAGAAGTFGASGGGDGYEGH
ncbi:hypothetical protein ACWDY7_10070 [Streptomyces calvus]|uniref:Uncharacterized protein n=1 Tax=Streptomyces calvus TaxID=67282 RepID=A0AA40S9Z5_9ACTN|nr:hypothetical protein [Streptomyces calvus]MBA8942614.1 hypothetical protein [Streptomyces calvus]GGP68269.1 hypothetical protein GCM10010247_46300 [Streptomyces calvus]